MPLLDLKDSGDVKITSSTTTDPTLLRATGRVDKVHVDSSHGGVKSASQPLLSQPVSKWFRWSKGLFVWVAGIVSAVIGSYVAYKLGFS